MSTTIPLQPTCYYHIFNRGNDRESIFREGRNYVYFLELYNRYIDKIADTFAFCLLPNHFHFLTRIKTNDEINPSRSFSNLFNAYTKTINKGYNHTGSLFQKCFGRRLVESDEDLLNLVAYIHLNPQKHGLVHDFQKWRWSSYYDILTSYPTRPQYSFVIELFGGVDQFREYHKGIMDENKLGLTVTLDE
jgi:putative transposase